MKRVLNIFSAIALPVLLLALVVTSVSADSNYNSGSYGSCQYNTCGISLTSNGTVNVSVTPTSSTKCSVASDVASVFTDSSTGYALTISDFDTTNSMSGSNGGTIAASSSTSASPHTLSANTWGYRVDGILGFGAGPASAISNGSIPSVTFGFIPSSTATADTIATSSGAADPAVSTTIWYGLCADTTVPSGTYSDSVVYTAVVN